MDSDIFVMTDIKAPRRSDGKYTYQIRCFDSKGNERTIWDRRYIETYKIEQSTEYQAEMVALIHALKRFNKPCNLNIYINSQYIKTGVEEWSKAWIKNNWITAKGNEVANASEWKELLQLLEQHTVIFHVKEHHEYYKVMENALKN